ncbi:MAG: DUF368 domain-containing protein [Haloarculaceae archaeon]
MTTAPEDAQGRTVRESVPPLREWARTFVIGICMGSADAVPGVSGGTIALIAGIYERLIDAITAVTPGRIVRFLRALTPLDGGFSLRPAVGVFEELDGWFLVALVGGVGTAVVAVTRVVEYARHNAPVVLFGFFFGLIAASAVILLREVSVRGVPEVAAAVLGFAIAFLLSGEATVLQGGGLLVVFGAGAVGVSAMILPGVSGSLLLIVLGQYTRMTETLKEFVDALGALVTGGSLDRLVDPGAVVVAFILGGLVGLFSVARLVRWALERNRHVTLAFLVALVVGALRAPVDRVAGKVGFTSQVALTFAVVAIVGAAFVLVIDYYAVDIDLDAA